MEAIKYITDWIKWLNLIVPIGAGCTLTYFSMKKSFSLNDDDIATYSKRMTQTVKAAIIIVSISSIITVVKSFFQ